MGVTDFIRIDEVRQEIDSTYPNPGEDVKRDIKVKNSGYSHKLIGNSFEYLCKLSLYRKCGQVVRPQERGKQHWGHGETPRACVKVFDGMRWDEYENISNKEEWREVYGYSPVWDRRSTAIKWKKDQSLSKLVNQFVETGMNTKEVVRASILNAGWRPSDSVQTWINRDSFEEDLLDEMEVLFDLLREQTWITGNVVFEKPMFGNHRHILPGEGDFIVDDMIIDIKTTQNRSFTNAFWRQLLMYYILNDIQRLLHDIDGRTYEREPYEKKYPEINRVGIYYARYGELKTIDLCKIIEDRIQYEEFRAWIIDRAIEEHRHPQHNYTAIREHLTDPYDFKRQQTLSDFSQPSSDDNT